MKSFLILAFGLLFAASAIAGDDDFERFEINTFVKKDNLTLGIRKYVDYDYSQYIFRYDFPDSPFRAEYRRIDKFGKSEDWFRFQMKHFKRDGFFYNSRIEHRNRESKANIFRYRPQFGYQHPSRIPILGKPFLVFEPHFQLTYEGRDLFFSHMQTFIGTKFEFRHIDVTPFLEIDTKAGFEKELAFFGVEMKYTF